MIPDANCQNLFHVVQDLWPSCRLTPKGFEAIWKGRLQRYDYTAVSDVLENHRADVPDATKPEWEAVIGILGKQAAEQQKADDSPSLEELDREREQTGRFLDAMTDAELEALRVEALEGMTRVTGFTESPTRTWLMEADLRTHDVLRSYLGGHLRHQGRL